MNRIDVFGKWTVGRNFKTGEFRNIDEKTRKKLIVLMSRISEKSYRRGFQHGKCIDKSVDPVAFRFHADIDHSPYTDTFFPNGRWESKSGHSAVARLFMEYALTELGFVNPTKYD